MDVVGDHAARGRWHLLPVRRTRAVPSDRKAFELLPDDDAYKIREKEAYNSFLRRKVHAMLVAMAAGAARYDFDYAFLLDYDTAVNVTNLQQFANALPGGGDAPIFTGRCIQRGLNQPGGGRKWVARYMRALAANDTVGARGIAEMMPPSRAAAPACSSRAACCASCSRSSARAPRSPSPSRWAPASLAASTR